MGIFSLVEFGYAKLLILKLQKYIAYYVVYLSDIGVVNRMVVDVIKFVYICFIKILIFMVVEKYLISQI